MFYDVCVICVISRECVPPWDQTVGRWRLNGVMRRSAPRDFNTRFVVVEEEPQINVVDRRIFVWLLGITEESY
jgi:hypothetical protein